MKDDIITAVQNLLTGKGITVDSYRLSFLVDYVYDTFLIETNREELPELLNTTVIMTVFSLYYNDYQLDTNGNISSISEDGRTVNFDLSTYQTNFAGKITTLENVLNKFKKLYRVEADSE